jgi:hypothetical protein
MSVGSREAIDIEKAVKARYSGAAKAPEASLCCPTSHDYKQKWWLERFGSASIESPR